MFSNNFVGTSSTDAIASSHVSRGHRLPSSFLPDFLKRCAILDASSDEQFSWRNSEAAHKYHANVQTWRSKLRSIPRRSIVASLLSRVDVSIAPLLCCRLFKNYSLQCELATWMKIDDFSVAQGATLPSLILQKSEQNYQIEKLSH